MEFNDFLACLQWIQSSFNWCVDRIMSVSLSGIPLVTLLVGICLMTTIVRVFLQPMLGAAGSDGVRYGKELIFRNSFKPLPSGSSPKALPSGRKSLPSGRK